MIPTLRVAHPSGDGFMTINADEYNPEAHGDLYHTQAPGFQGVPEKPKPKTPIDPAVRDKAAALFGRVLDLGSMSKGGPAFSTLSPDQQMLRLRDAENEIEEQVKRKAAYEAQWAEDRERHKAAIAAKDAETAEAARLAREAADSAGQAAEKLTGQGEAKAPDAPAPGAPANPFAKPATPPEAPEPLSVSQGPGRKWFVMQGTTPVTEGFATKGEAETKRTALEAAKG